MPNLADIIAEIEALTETWKDKVLVPDTVPASHTARDSRRHRYITAAILRTGDRQ